MKIKKNGVTNEQNIRIKKNGVTINLTESDLKRIVKKVLTERVVPYKKVDKINLPNGDYLGDGGGNVYSIKDKNKKDTGYQVKSKVGIRGMKDNDPVTISNGIPNSETWGEGGEYVYKDVGYKAPTNDPNKQKIVGNKVAKEGIKNISNNMINAKPFKGTLSSYYFGGIFQGVKYLWDLRGVSGFNEVSGKDLTGLIYTEKNNLLPKLDIDDGAENGAWVAFQNGSSFNKSTQWVLYNSTSGVKVKTPN